MVNSIEEYNIFLDSYGGIVEALDYKSLSIDYRNGSFINTTNIKDGVTIMKLANEIKNQLAVLKGQLKDDLSSFFNTLSYKFDNIDIENNAINVIRLKDEPFIKFIISVNNVEIQDPYSYIDYRSMLSRFNGQVLFTITADEFLNYYNNHLNEYQPYLENILEYSMNKGNTSLYDKYLNSLPLYNEALVNLLNTPLVNIETVLCLYSFIDTYLQRTILDNNNKKDIEYFKYILTLYIVQYQVKYDMQVKNDILLVEPHILYDKYNLVVINGTVADSIQDDELTDISSLAFGAVCNNNTKYIITKEQLLSMKDILSKQAIDYINIKRSSNEFKTKREKLSIIINEFDTFINYDYETRLASLTNKTQQELKKLFLEGLSFINYIDFKELEKYIMRDVLFRTDMPTIQSIFIEKLYEDNNIERLNDYNLYNITIIKTIIDILFYNIELTRT